MGWWGRKETLHPPIFEPTTERLNQTVAQTFKQFKDDPSTYVVVMTGRVANAGDRIKEILNAYHIHADEYFFQGQKDIAKDPRYPRIQDTFAYKAFVIKHRLMSPEIQVVEIFDDREDHIPKFLQLGKDLKQNWPKLQNVIIHDVRQNKNHTV